MKLPKVWNSSFLIIMFFSKPSSALPFSYQRCLHSSENSEWHGLLHRVSTYGKGEKRKALSVGGPQLGLTPAEINQIRSTTGIVSCPGSDANHETRGSAVLVGDGGHIITAAHIFKNENTNEFREPLEECYFEPQDKHGKRYYFTFSHNNKSGLIIGKDFPAEDGDYAVATLRTKVPNVKTFPLDLSQKPMFDGDKTIAVSALMSDMKFPGDQEPIVQECSIRNTQLKATTFMFSDCGSMHGSSGSVQLHRDQSGQLTIKGLIVGGSEGGKNQEYSYLKDHTESIGVDGDLLGTLLAVDPSITNRRDGIH